MDRYDETTVEGWEVYRYYEGGPLTAQRRRRDGAMVSVDVDADGVAIETDEGCAALIPIAVMRRLLANLDRFIASDGKE